jgi:hypothetical protein
MQAWGDQAAVQPAFASSSKRGGATNFFSKPIYYGQKYTDFAPVALHLNEPLSAQHSRNDYLRDLYVVLIRLQTYATCPRLTSLKLKTVSELIDRGKTLIKVLDKRVPPHTGDYLTFGGFRSTFPGAARLLEGNHMWNNVPNDTANSDTHIT